jgi:hypothetical protein
MSAKRGRIRKEQNKGRSCQQVWLKIGASEVNALRFFEKRNAFLLSFAPLGIRRFPSIRVPRGSAPAPGLHIEALPPTVCQAARLVDQSFV